MLKKTKKGYWIDAQLLTSFLISLYNDASTKRKNIKILGSSEGHKLDGVKMTLTGIMEFLHSREEYGTLRWRYTK